MDRMSPCALPDSVCAGDLLAGKYRVEAVLGAGGMGVVVSARHEQLDRRVAIKFIRPSILGNEEAVERFLREARAAGRLKSEHAAKVLDVGTLDSGAPYMVMELLEGNDLAQELRCSSRLSVEQVAGWMVQACEALAEAHAAGIVHRDVKPKNLFLARTVGDALQVKVLDFGASKAAAASDNDISLTRTTTMLGTPSYMAPEQIGSPADVDARADVWGLGVVLFELLTHVRPFQAPTLPALCLKVANDPPLPLRELRPDLPPELYEVVARCLQKAPAERFADAAELAEALQPFAPASSSAIVERARAAAGRSAPPPAPSDEPESAPPSVSQEVVRQTTAGWGPGNPPPPIHPRRSRRSLGMVACAAAVALLWSGVLGMRSPGPSPRLYASSSIVTAARTPPAVPSPTEPTVDPTPRSASLADTAPGDAGAALISIPPAAPKARPPAVRRPAKARTVDDDIPALR
jgi:serine/threonine-protein kinase